MLVESQVDIIGLLLITDLTDLLSRWLYIDSGRNEYLSTLINRGQFRSTGENIFIFFKRYKP